MALIAAQHVLFLNAHISRTTYSDKITGAIQVAIIHGLLVICKLQCLDVYTCLVDVLQRECTAPASQAIDLTPRVWKALLSHNPMKSNIVLAGQ